MSTITALEPTTTVSLPDRRIRTATTLGLDAEGRRVVVETTTAHSREGRRYRATTTWHYVETRDGYSVTSWSSDHAYGVLISEAATRYSAKHLHELHDEALVMTGAGRCSDHIIAEALQYVVSQA